MILETRQNVFENNDRQTNRLWNELKKDKIFLIKLKSSPGAKRTTTVPGTARTLKNPETVDKQTRKLDPDISIIPISTRTGQALDT